MGKVDSWGFNLDEEATKEATTFEWFELILNYEDLKADVKESPRVRSVYNKLQKFSRSNPVEAAVKVTTDYLQMLWESALEAISLEMGPTWTKGLDCKVILTKPAIWSNLACERTEFTARRAINTSNQQPFRQISIQLISEPEAAAQTVLSSLEITKRPDMTKVSVATTCDIYISAN